MRRSLAVLLLLASPTLGQAPPTPPAPTPPESAVASITVPVKQVIAGQSLVLTSEGSVGEVRWKLISPKAPFIPLDQNGKKGFGVWIPVAEAGSYKFRLFAGIPGAITLDQIDSDDVDIMVVPAGTTPPSPPNPNPNPTPNPDPPAPPAPVPVTLSKPFWVEMVYDATPSKVTPNTRSMINSFELESVAREAGGYYQPIATQSADFARRNLGKYVGVGTGLIPTPALIVRDAKGEKILGELAPKDERAMMDRLKALIGGAP